MLLVRLNPSEMANLTNAQEGLPVREPTTGGEINSDSLIARDVHTGEIETSKAKVAVRITKVKGAVRSLEVKVVVTNDHIRGDTKIHHRNWIKNLNIDHVSQGQVSPQRAVILVDQVGTTRKSLKIERLMSPGESKIHPHKRAGKMNPKIPRSPESYF